MDFRIQDLPKSFVSEASFGAMACCIISYQVSVARHQGDVTLGGYTVIAIGGLIFVVWLLWALRKYLSGRKVIAMPRRAGRVSETVNWLLFTLWILTAYVDKMCHTAWVVVAWCLLAVSIGYYFYHCNKYGFTD